MAIQKQEFYEGAAIHQLIRGGGVRHVRADPPFFMINDDLTLHIKYSTKVRGPWSFTFGGDEQAILAARSRKSRLLIGLVCGGDGVARLDFHQYLSIAPLQANAVRIACQRRPSQHYTVVGPSGELVRKVPPSAWSRLLTQEEHL